MKGEREKGAAAILSLCAMATVFWLGMSLWTIVDYGVKGSDEYLEETRLRLAAEGRVEQLAAKLETDPAGIDDMAKGVWQSYGEAYAEKDVLVKAYLRHVSAGENEEDIFLKAWAQPERKSKWSKGKIVCGWLHRKGEDCVWRGWRAEDD